MTTLTQTRPATPAPHPAAGQRSWRLSFGGVLRSEFTKLFSLRSSYWLLGLLVAGYMGLGALISLMADEPSRQPIGTGTFVMGAQPGQMLIVVLGALVMTSEYSTGAIRSSLAAAPARTPLLAAKAIMVTLVTAVATVVAIGASILGSMPFWPSRGVQEFTTQFLYVAGASVFYLVCIALISLALGTLIRATPGTLVAGLGMVLIVPMVLQGFFGSFEWAQTIYRYMPDAQLSNLISSEFAQAAPGQLAGWQSGLVLLGWVALTMTAATIRLRRTDA